MSRKPTPGDLSTLDPAQKRALLVQRLQQGTPPRTPRRAPLSLAQQRLWFIEQMNPGQPVYTITAALQLDGTLEVARLQTALNGLRARHESLRTRFEDTDGTPLQVIDAPEPLALDCHDLRARPEAVASLLAEAAAGPLIWSAGRCGAVC